MLPPGLRQALSATAQRDRVVLASDFDGVLAPLVDDPMTSRPADGSIAALRAAARAPGTTVALVSGRDLETLAALCGMTLTSDDPLILIGSHGSQSSRPDLVCPTELDDGRRATLRSLNASIDRVVRDHPGSRIELKPATVVLHTRGIDPAIAEAAARAAHEVAALHDGTRVMRGKDVVELAVVEMNKGLALQQLGRSVGADVGIYFGDDITDEDAFAVLSPQRGDVTVKVGDGDTVATHRLRDTTDVLTALRFFAQHRADWAGTRPGRRG